MTDQATIDRFRERAELVSARVYPVPDMAAALEKAVSLCLDKIPLEPQMKTGDAFDPSQRIMAAPNLDGAAFDTLAQACQGKGITLLKENLRQYPWGIDMGVTLMDYGIAETGSLVLDSRSEETRLATMLSELHTAILPVSCIRESALAMDEELKTLTRDPGSYMAFITGASRTADIERVLAMGVHGPLELHIMLVEEA